MTMVNSSVSSTPSNRGGGGVSLRKTNKPLMEKRRRARINDSLSQLKSLVIHSSKKDSSQFSKLEKADILELTVKHLRGLQAQQQQQHHRQQHPVGVQPVVNGPADSIMNGKYCAGFVECANEVIRYLDQSQGLNQDTKSKVVSHLANCLQLVSNASQPKVAPQPHPQPLPQQTTAPPANAAAILAAAAAAAGNSTTTTTQLPNGQIIQIVNNPLHNVQPASGSAVPGLNPNTAGQGIHLSGHTDQGAAQPKNIAVAVQPMNKPLPNPAHNAQSAYIHYAQPLHIQIPPIVSPVLIKKCSTAKPVAAVECKESSGSFSSSSSLACNQPTPPEQVHDVVSSSTSLASSPRTTTSPPTLYPGHPKARAQKQLNFYQQDDLKCDKFSRIGKNCTTPSSSSSSSSSDGESSSPLNLSQSPPFLDFKSDQRRSMFGKVPQKLDLDPKQSSCPYPTKMSHRAENLSFRDFRDGTNKMSSNTTSVIVNSRRCADLTEGKYWSMMEEDRLCTRQRNTPSPASSVGEERLWRPW